MERGMPPPAVDRAAWVLRHCVACWPRPRPAPGCAIAPGDLLDPRTYSQEIHLPCRPRWDGVQKYTRQGERHLAVHRSRGHPLDDSIPKPIGAHFLNPATAGSPVWQLKDESSKSRPRTQTMDVGPRGNHLRGPRQDGRKPLAGSDGDRLTSTTWVQRLNTSGGVAPPERACPATKTTPYAITSSEEQATTTEG